MNRLTLYLFLALGSNLAFGQTAVIVKIDGNASINGSPNFLKAKDLLQMTDSIEFHDNLVSIRCYLEDKGVFTISNNFDPRFQNEKRNELIATLINEVKITKITNQLRGRNGIIETQSNLTGFFNQFSTENNPLLIIDSLLISIDKKVFDLNDDIFFYIRFFGIDNEINKKIEILDQEESNQISIILKDDYFRNESNEENCGLNKTATIFYYKGMEELSFPISKFYLHSIPLKTIQDELCVIKGISKSEDQGLSFIKDYLNKYYGSISTPEVMMLIKKLNCIPR